MASYRDWDEGQRELDRIGLRLDQKEAVLFGILWRLNTTEEKIKDMQTKLDQTECLSKRCEILEQDNFKLRKELETLRLSIFQTAENQRLNQNLVASISQLSERMASIELSLNNSHSLPSSNSNSLPSSRGLTPPPDLELLKQRQEEKKRKKEQDKKLGWEAST